MKHANIYTIPNSINHSTLNHQFALSRPNPTATSEDSQDITSIQMHTNNNAYQPSPNVGGKRAVTKNMERFLK